MQAFGETLPRRARWRWEATQCAVDALLRIYYQWRGNRNKLPDIAIVDWEGVPTTSEFHLFVDYFAGATASPSPSAIPATWSFVNGVLYADGRAVDYVYKRVLTNRTVAGAMGLDHPIIVRAHAPAPSAWRTPSPASWCTRKPALPSPRTNATPISFRRTEQEAIRLAHPLDAHPRRALRRWPRTVRTDRSAAVGAGTTVNAWCSSQTTSMAARVCSSAGRPSQASGKRRRAGGALSDPGDCPGARRPSPTKISHR
jgi:hypothetical protein